MRIVGVFFGAWCGFLVSMGPALADLFEVKEAVEAALCRKLATDYANEPSAFTVQAIAQLQICLAQTLQNAISPAAIPQNFDIQSPLPLTGIVDTTLPTPPTPPTPPTSMKIP